MPKTKKDYDEEAVSADIEDTIRQAEGNFLERNGVVTEKPKPKKKAKQKIVVGKNQLRDAEEVLKKYKSGKSNFTARVIDDEEWWKLRHWDRLRKDNNTMIQPTSAWLFNSVMNKVADYCDNYPEANIRARTKDDVEEAERIKHVLPMILEYNNYEKTYEEVALAKIKHGTGITGVFWNSDKDDIDIKPIDVLTIFWESGVTDIQTSRNVFTVELIDNDVLREMYPDVQIKGGSSAISMAKYLYEDSIDTTDKTAVIDWYYKRKGILHYCKFVEGSDIPLVATENEPDVYPNGLYDDGQYPFVVDTLYKMEGDITGFGVLDVCRSPQEYIDRLDQAIITNALMCAVPRYFKRKGSTVNDKEFLDWNTTLVECSNLEEENLRQIQVQQLGADIFNARDGKIQELKQTSGNSDVLTGTSTQGITAASSIAQLIETGSKSSRMALRGSYRAFRQMTYMIIERMRQFYNEPRYVRIIGDDGEEEFELYDNRGLVEQTTQSEITGEEYSRIPQFDLEISAAKASPYSKVNQNELALQFYQYQFFNPQNTDATLAALEMMDFDHKEDVIAKVSENGTLLDIVQQLQQQMAMIQEQNEKLKVLADNAYGTNLSGMMQPQAPTGEPTGQTSTGSMPSPEETAALGRRSNSLNTGLGDNSQAEQRRRQAADATEVSI